MTTMVELPQVKGVKNIPIQELFTSGHRTCQGCESALSMRLMIKAAGPRSIVVGSTGCMYVANTTYYSTPWVVPWMHTQLGSSGSAATGTAAGLRALMRKGKIKDEPINVIAFCGDGGGVDMGLSALSAALTTDYNMLILLYDNESYANTDIQVSGSSPWGANSTFSPPGKSKHIMNRRWKKNTAPMLATGHPDCRYVATTCGSYGLDMTNKIRRALTIGGPTFIHSIDPCPKGWDYDPKYSHELGMLSIETGLWVLYEIIDGELILNGPSRAIAKGMKKRRPVKDYLERQGRFAHFTAEDHKYFQEKVDKSWEEWYLPGVLPVHPQLED